MSQIEIVEETIWIPITKINDITTISLLETEEYVYITFLIISLLYSIRLLKLCGP